MIYIYCQYLKKNQGTCCSRRP